MFPFPSPDDLEDLIELARREDLGQQRDDVTSRLMVPADQLGVGTLVQKQVLFIKDNHLAHVPLRDLAAYLNKVVTESQAEAPTRLVEIEVDHLEQLREVLKVDGVQVILLDNMDCPTMQAAVELRDKAGRRGQVELEASGGVTLENVRPIAQTGVERIAIGSVTHSAPALDIGLDVEPSHELEERRASA